VYTTAAKITSLVIVLGLLTACRPTTNDNVQPTQIFSCPALPQDFKENDLVGTWVTSYSLNDKDTLVIKEDGTYKQIYSDPDSGNHYESDWLEWWIEKRDSGYIRLHLKGMHRAGEIESIFNRQGGGIDPEQFTAIDYCENVVVEMPHEVILIVTGSTENTSRGIILRQTRLSGTEWTWSFRLQESSK